MVRSTKRRYEVAYTFGVEFDTFGLGEIEAEQPVREALVRFFAMRWLEAMVNIASEIVDGTLDGVAECHHADDDDGTA